MATALILDGWSRAAVECVQSLGRRGIETHVAGSPDCPAFWSRRAAARHLEPPASDLERFLVWLREIDRAHRYNLIVPTTEASLSALSQLGADDSLRAKAVLPSPASLEACLDKARTVELAKSLGVPAPETVVIINEGQAPLTREYPHVLKPARSIVRNGGGLKQLKPVLVSDPEARRIELPRLLGGGAVLEQETVPGSGYGIELLYRHGELVWFFAHERLHEGSGTGLGSGSIYRRSVEPQVEILDEAVRLLNALRWHGVAMVEFRRLEDGRHWLMEVNPRLWGSLALAIDAGVDFPYGLFCLASGAAAPPQPAYRRQYYTRVMFEDLDWLRRQAPARPAMQTLRDLTLLWRPLVLRESWDHFDWRDLGVLRRKFGIFMSSNVRGLLGKFGAKLREREARSTHCRNLARLRRARPSPMNLLFVCHGNICRSPVAEALARIRLPAATLASAGFFPVDARPAPENVRAAAAEYGVDLGSHASRRLTKDMVSAASVILLFDVRNYSQFKRGFPQYLDKVLMLGLFRCEPRLDIDDPYGRSQAAAATVVGEISEAVTRLAELFDAPVPDSGRPSCVKGTY